MTEVTNAPQRRLTDREGNELVYAFAKVLRHDGGCVARVLQEDERTTVMLKAKLGERVHEVVVTYSVPVRI